MGKVDFNFLSINNCAGDSFIPVIGELENSSKAIASCIFGFL